MRPIKLVLLASVLTVAACAHGGISEPAQTSEPAHKPSTIRSPAAKAVLIPTSGNDVQGVVTFTPSAEGMVVHADVTGLTPGAHGFHIHETGDCSAPDGTSAGGHFNPTEHEHGAPADTHRHAGDMGNIIADESGHGVLEWTDPDMTVDGEKSIIGRAVIVHADEDDYATQPTGNAGARVACGVIE